MSIESNFVWFPSDTRVWRCNHGPADESAVVQAFDVDQKTAGAEP